MSSNICKVKWGRTKTAVPPDNPDRQKPHTSRRSTQITRLL